MKRVHNTLRQHEGEVFVMSSSTSLRRIGAALSLTVIASLLINTSAMRPAQASTAKQQTTIHLMVTASWWTPIMDQIAKADAAATGVTIDVQKLPEGNTGKTVIETKMASGDLSDLFAWAGGSAFLSQLNPAKTLMPITSQPYVNALTDSVRPAMSYQGQVYGIPDSANGWGFEGIFYNKQIFAKLHLAIPQTEAQFFATSAAIKKAGIVPFWISSKDTWSDTQIPEDYWAWIMKNNPGDVTKIVANKLKLANIPEWDHALGVAHELIAKGYTNANYTTATYGEGLQALLNGSVAMYAQGTWIYSALQTTNPSQLNALGFFPQPIDGHNIVSISPPQAFFISKQTKNLAAVNKWLQFYATTGQKIYYAHAQGIPMFKNVTSKLSPTFQAISVLVNQGKARLNEQGDLPTMFPNWESICQAALSGSMSPTAAAQALDQGLAQAMAQIGYPGW
jgi:raffinose/stachyose/melibiose transport system substrate-binding protein